MTLFSAMRGFGGSTRETLSTVRGFGHSIREMLSTMRDLPDTILISTLTAA